MANPSLLPEAAPHARNGIHYDNPSTKPLRAQAAPLERDGVQRLVWQLFFALVASAVVVGVLLSWRHA